MPTIVFRGIPPGRDIDLVTEIERLLTGAPFRSAVDYANAPAPSTEPLLEIVASPRCAFLGQLADLVRVLGYPVAVTETAVLPDVLRRLRAVAPNTRRVP